MIASLYTGILVLVYICISAETILARRKHKVSIGVGPNSEISSIVSAHANFAAYVPILILQLWFAESSQLIAPIWLHVIGVAIVVGRFSHYLAFRAPKMNFKLRVAGMQLTMWPMIVLAVINIVTFIVQTGRA